MSYNPKPLAAEPGIFAHSRDISFDKIAIFVSCVLIYVMGKFQFTDLLGIKRMMEGVLIAPMLLYFLIRLPAFTLKKHVNPLLGLVILMLMLNLINHMNMLWIFDYLFSIIGIYIVLTVSRENVEFGVKCIVSIATLFALMALFQFVLLLIYPSLAIHTKIALDEYGNWVTLVPNEGVSIVSSVNPVSFFGLMTYDRINVIGLEFGRMRSFTAEPSLLVVFFLFPASLGFFLNKRFWTKCSLVLVVFCIMSFSGSIHACMVFSFAYVLLSFFFPTRIVFLYFPLAVLVLTLAAFMTIGIETFSEFDTMLGNSDSVDFLAHGNSLVVRANGLIFALNEALNSPFGSKYIREIPVSIFLSTMISAGWIGAVLLFNFFYKLIKRIDLKLKFDSLGLQTKAGAAVLFGVFCTICLFNDYAMLNYTGLVLMIFTYRLLEPQILSRNKKTDVAWDEPAPVN